MLKQQPKCTEGKIWGKSTLKNCFLYNHFRNLSQKSRTISKTLRHIFQNCSLRVRKNNFRLFEWSMKNWLIVFCLWAEILDFCRNFFGRVAKRAFQLSKVVESNLYHLTVIYSGFEWVGFWFWEKSGRGVKTVI